MKVSDFDFDLPADLIAQDPPAERGTSRLLALDRSSGRITHHQFGDLPSLLNPGDVIVVNDTRVFPARLVGKRLPGGGAAECFLVTLLEAPEAPHKGVPYETGHGVPYESRVRGEERWVALVHPGQRLRMGSRMVFEGGARHLHAEVTGMHFHGRRTVRLWTDDGTSVRDAVDALGHVPLPPYIKRGDASADRERYQTVYARERGSIAAPTAGLHFTPALLAALAGRGIATLSITLHIGYGTFQPVRVERVEEHEMESEHYEVSADTAAALAAAQRAGRRIIAVGTTTTRTLESLAVEATGGVQPGNGETALFIHPGHRFQLVSGLITNFHLPRSSLVMLVSAFGGTDHVRAAYRDAIAQGYRFYSYGDAMLVL